MSKQKPFEYMYQDRLLKVHLNNIRNRLIDDIGPYIELVVDYASKNKESQNKAIGNFSLIRMLFPIIEAVSRTIGITPQELLEKLDVPLPFLTWSLFRDVFSHNDEFESAYYYESEKMYIAHPGIAIPFIKEPVAHMLDDDKLIINPVYIYSKLTEFINPENFKDKIIQVPTGILYIDMENPEVKQIVTDLHKIAGTYGRQK